MKPSSLKDLRNISALKSMCLLAMDWFMIVLCLLWIAEDPSLFSLLVSWIVVGTRQHAIAIMGHDGAHGLLLKNRFLNDSVSGLLVFWPLFMPFLGYREWHHIHHSFLGTVKDSEIDVKGNRRFELGVSRCQILMRFILDLLGFGIPSLNRQIKAIQRAGFIDYVGPLALWASAGLLFYSLECLWILGFWLFCMLTSFWAIFRIREFFEHTGIKKSYRFEPNSIIKFIFFPNFTWCHYEHHELAQIPCYNLPKLRARLESHAPVLSFGDLLDHFENPDFEKIGLKSNALS